MAGGAEQRPGNPQEHRPDAPVSREGISPTPEKLIISHLAPDFYRSGLHNVVLRENCYPVWRVINYQQTLGDEVEDTLGQTAKDNELTREQVTAANAYYDRHRDVIDARILLERTQDETDPLFEVPTERARMPFVIDPESIRIGHTFSRGQENERKDLFAISRDGSQRYIFVTRGSDLLFEESERDNPITRDRSVIAVGEHAYYVEEGDDLIDADLVREVLDYSTNDELKDTKLGVAVTIDEKTGGVRYIYNDVGIWREFNDTSVYDLSDTTTSEDAQQQISIERDVANQSLELVSQLFRERKITPVQFEHYLRAHILDAMIQQFGAQASTWLDGIIPILEEVDQAQPVIETNKKISAGEVLAHPTLIGLNRIYLQGDITYEELIAYERTLERRFSEDTSSNIK